MTAEVIIVGAGVIGAATALQLSLLGVRDILVVDRATAGAGMSCRSSALVRMHYTFPAEVQLAVRSDAMFRAWPELTGRPSCIRRTGFARIVAPGEESALRANLDMQRALGARVEPIDAASLKELAPGFHVADISCAAWEPDGGYGDGAVVAGDLLAAARARGVRYRPNCAVSSLLRTGDRVTGIQAGADGSEHAGAVILAAGVWSPALAQTAGLQLPIETELHKVAVLAHGPAGGAPFACIDSVTQTYFRPEAGGARTLVGSFVGPRGVDPDAVPDSADAQSLAPQVQAASHRVPAFAEAGITGGVTGVYDMTPDARPLLGPMPGLDGLIVAAGFSGMGFKIAPAVGESLAGLIAGPPPGSVDLAPFRPSRFDEGAPIQAPHPYSDD
ncbi:MAG TPA: FAD-binding oxidoreductase [Streptosporangiaceae bacterium]|nr:FAD-binding oxidoreductase [Streptosporangiaceae bacterium]